jgi:hypothetical protein
MFVSKERNIVVPQSEHQRLAGVLARNWGNQDFSLPSVPKDSFELGVATHDRAFGYLDTMIVGQMSNEDRAIQVDIWLNTTYSDLKAELTVLLHVRRLMNTPERQDLYRKLDCRIQEIVRNENLDLVAYEQADTITNFCDLIAFDFSFESSVEQTVAVYQRENTMIDITYKLEGGKVVMDNWPFCVPKIEGYMLGYKRDEYPRNLQPIMLNYEITP